MFKTEVGRIIGHPRDAPRLPSFTKRKHEARMISRHQQELSSNLTNYTLEEHRFHPPSLLLKLRHCATSVRLIRALRHVSQK